MCGIGKTPDTPTLPERQTAKLPDNGATADRTADLSRRRRAMAGMILTSPQGTMGAPTTTSTLGG